MKRKIDNVYGFTYKEMLSEADEVFGKGHFLAVESESIDDKILKIRKLMQEQGIDGFDIIDLTLVIKDMEDPEKVLRKCRRLLNPEGGIIYIRELDDDYIDAYPDEKGYIKKLKELLELDDGAGERHLGKRVYTFLKRSGADKVYMSDEIISTANHKAAYQFALVCTYFSYLLPELRALANSKKDNGKKHRCKEAYDWLMDNYNDIENMFCSSEFYFRAGYVAGYGVYTMDYDIY